MPSKKSQEQKKLSKRTMQYTSSLYDELFESVINSKESPALRKSPRMSLISSPTQGSSPQYIAEEPQECASLENSQTTRSQNSPKAITKISEINSKPSKKLSDYSENNQTDSVSTLQSEEFRNNAKFSTPVEEKIKTKIISKGPKNSLSSKAAKKKHKSFRNALNSLNSSILNGTLSQASSSISIQDMIPLSQPPKNLSHQQKMLWLRERRGTGLYACCDKCQKWRYLETPDPLDLPELWFCKMNPDPKFNRCTIPEKTIPIIIDDDLIYNKYTAGSLVWARYLNYPWWPAIVEDDPDTEQYYWTEPMSDTPNYYHVMFYDARNISASRGWVTPNRVKPFLKNITMKNLKTAVKFGNRIRQAKQVAQEASKLNIRERLRKYGFLAYSNIKIHTPVATPESSDNEDDGPSTPKPICKSITPKNNNPKRRNTMASEDYLNNEIKNSFEGKNSCKKSGIKNRRFTVAEENFEKKEQCTAKVSKPRKSVTKTLDTRRTTISEMNFEDDETDTEYEELFETRPKIINVTKARRSTSKSPKINKKRGNILSEHIFENISNKFPGQLLTNDQASSSTNLEKSGIKSQLASESKTQKNFISGGGKNEKNYSKIKRRNTFANDNGNLNDAFNLCEQNIFPDTPKTTCLSKSLENDGFNKNTSKSRKRKNSGTENDIFSKTHITTENNKSNSNFENKIKLVYKTIFDEDSNDAIKMTDKKRKLLAAIETNGNKAVTETNGNKPKKETPAKKPLTKKDLIWPLKKVDNSSNPLSSSITTDSSSPTIFNSGKNMMTSFDFGSASHNETKVKKRLGYSRKK